MKDKRKHPRISIMGLLRITLSGESQSREAYLANISQGGIGIYLNKDVKPVREKEEQVNARVMWSCPTGDLCMAGLQFERMSKEKYELVLKKSL